jgi:hypothetical protein
MGGIDQMVLDMIHLLPLCLHHHRHVEGHLVELQKALRYLLVRVVPVLYLHHCFQHLSPPMLSSLGIWKKVLSEKSHS